MKTIENVLNWLKTIATFKNGKKGGKKGLKTVQTDFFLTIKKKSNTVKQKIKKIKKINKRKTF